MNEHDNYVSQFVNLLATILILTILIVSFSGCEVVEYIFKAGMVVGILLIIGIVLLAVFIMRKVSGRV
jgi:uncharacterized membrane protein